MAVEVEATSDTRGGEEEWVVEKQSWGRALLAEIAQRGRGRMHSHPERNKNKYPGTLTTTNLLHLAVSPNIPAMHEGQLE